MKILNLLEKNILIDINKIKYIDHLRYPRHKSSLSRKLNIDYWSMINPPAMNSEKSTTTDLTNVIRLANGRTQSETDLVIKVDKDPFLIFAPLIEKHNLHFPESTFKNLYIFLSEIVTDIKYFYNRARPNQLAQFYGLNIDILVTNTHHTPSYPSGHTAYASLVACILSDLYPDHSRHFWDIVNICGNCRVLQGVHFMADNKASVELVKKVYLPLKNFNLNFSHFYQ